MRRDKPEFPAVVASLMALALLGGSASFAVAQDRPSATAAFGELSAILKLRGEGDYERALADARRLAAEEPNLPGLQGTLTDLYLRLGRSDVARRDFEAWLERDPGSPHPLYGLARIDLAEGRLDAAAEKLKRAVALEPGFSEPFGPDGGLPDVFQRKNDLAQAIAYFHELTDSQPDNANAFSGLGWSYARDWKLEEAIDSFLEAIALDPDLSQAYHGLVQSYFHVGRYQKSLEYCDTLEEVAARTGELERVAYARMMQGTIAFFRGNYSRALGHLDASRKLAREIGDEGREAATVNNSAAVYATMGEHDRAVEYFEASLSLARKSGDERAELNALGNIGSVHREAGRYEEAIATYREAVKLAEAAGFKGQHGATLANMAEAFQLRGKLDFASRYFNEALSIAEAIGDTSITAYASASLGALARDRGDSARAVLCFERALAIGEQTGEIQAAWEAQAGLGSTYERAGDTERAIEHYAKAIALYDSVREQLAVSALGSSFLEDKHAAYPSIVQLLASRGELEEAFTYAEKYKAKGFLDILTRGQTLFETQLPESLRLELESVVAELHEAHAELSRERAVPERDRAALFELEARATSLELRKASLLERIRTEHGAFYALARSEPLDSSSLQRSVLEPGQVLVEYIVGEDRLSIFVVSADALHYREVPEGRKELSRKLEALSPVFEAESGNGLLNSELADFSLPPARALYRTLLEPVEEWLPEGSELVIVPDDSLFYLPFELLVADDAEAKHRYDFAGASFALERYAISYSPAASLLDPRLQRQRRAGAGRGLLAFGNPAFDEGPEAMPSLPNAEEEVRAIRDAFSGYDNRVVTGRDASETVFKREAALYGVLHFATHFSSDDRQPLYSQIALAGGRGGTDTETDDGVLQTFEIFDTELNAELAVLSACNTGRGRLRKGEGLIGMSRAFLYAGVPSLVMSLWSVDDRATARIMELFYRHLRSGMSKNEALRQAKLEYLDGASGDGKDPFYWAPFVLSGDWKPLTLPPESHPARRFDLAFVAGAVALLMGASVLARGILRRHRTARSS